MTVSKRTTKKISPTSSLTTTISSKGTTRTVSNKPNKLATRTTRSFNINTGKTRTTTSKKLSSGYTQRTSKTTGGFKSYKPKTFRSTSSTSSTSYKPKKSTPKIKAYRSSSRSSGSGVDMSGLLTLPVILLILLFGTIMYLWPVTIPYITAFVAVLVAIWVLIKVVLFLIPWVIWGAILYGLYILIELFV